MGILSRDEEYGAILPWLRHTDDFPNKPTRPATLTPENRRCYPVITIVYPRTFGRWISDGKPGSKPRKPEEIRKLIIGMAKATGWDHWPILGQQQIETVPGVGGETDQRGAGNWSRT